MKSSVYKVIFFSIDRRMKKVQDGKWLGMSNAIRILQVNQNNENNDNRKEDLKKTEDLSKKQTYANEQLKELLEEQARLNKHASKMLQDLGINRN